jgi:hypothetical protein
MARLEESRKRQLDETQSDHEDNFTLPSEAQSKKVRWGNDDISGDTTETPEPDDDNPVAEKVRHISVHWIDLMSALDLPGSIMSAVRVVSFNLLISLRPFPSGRIGCAYYEPVQSTIYVLEDTAESLHFDLTRMGACMRIESGLILTLWPSSYRAS